MRMARWLPRAVMLLAMLAAGPVRAAPVSGLQVTGAWIRYLPAGLPLAGYFQLKNPGDAPVTLVGADSPAFGSIMMHESVEDAGVSTMRALDSLTVAPGETAAFAPGGYHLMLMQPRPGLAPGQMVTITLRFRDGGKLPVNFRVKPPATP